MLVHFDKSKTKLNYFRVQIRSLVDNMQKIKIWFIKKIKMDKAVYSLFVLFTVFSIIAITPSAFADHSKVDINMAVGSSVLGCEEMNMCYMPYNAALDPGGEAMWHNIDTAAHTVTSGTPSDDDVGAVFDSSLVAAGGMFSYKFEEAGTYDYFCMVHPWMKGIVIVR